MESCLETEILDDVFLYRIAQDFELHGLPVKGLSKTISSDELISLIDFYCPGPNLKHYDLIESAWFRDHSYFLNRGRNGSSISPNGVILNWIKTPSLQVEHHKEYAEKYILGRSLNGHTDVSWVNSFLRRLSKEFDMNESYSIWNR
jgi:hypothetical protein